MNKTNSQVGSLLFFLLRANRARVALALVVSLVSGVSSAGLIALIHRAWEWEAIASPIWVWRFVAVLAVLIASGVASQLMVLHLALSAIADLRFTLCQKILATPLAHLEKLGMSRQLAVLTDDVSTVSRVLPNTPRFVIDATTLAAGVAYLAWLSWTSLLVLSVFILLGFVSYRELTRRSLVLMRHGRDVYDSLFEHFGALHDGIKQLKLNSRRRETFLGRDVRDSLEEYRSLNMVGRTLLVYAETLTRLLFFMLLGALIFGVPQVVVIPSEVLRGYLLMALFLYRPLGSLMALVPDFGRAAVSLRKIDDLGLSLDLDEDVADEPRVESPATWERIDLVGVTYSYRHDDERDFTVGPIDLSFRPGELVFILGGNGSGKTTLAKLVTSLYAPRAGEIRLDGVPVTEENRARYRELFSVVFSDYHLFKDLLGPHDGDLDGEARKYLVELQLDRKVEVVDGRLSTTALSQGQRKRLALLAAYLEDRPFYVFDEWAADQDPQFKKTFYTHVLPELKRRGKTALVITHDDRYTHIADWCVKLEEGRVLEAAVESTRKAVS